MKSGLVLEILHDRKNNKTGSPQKVLLDFPSMRIRWQWNSDAVKQDKYTYLTEGHHPVGLFLRPTFAIHSISVSKQIVVHAFVSQHWKQSRHLASSRHKYIWTEKLHSLRKNKILILALTKTPDRITNHWKIQHSSGGLHSHRAC